MMKPLNQIYAACIFTVLSLLLTACDSGGGEAGGVDTTPQPLPAVATTFTVGGTVTGLAGDGFILQNNSGDDLTITADGSFTFATSLSDGVSYEVSILSQPVNRYQNCIISNNSGTITGSNVSNITINCTTNSYAISGTVTGLTGNDLVLQNNGGDDLAVDANGDFTFSASVLSGDGYDVSVATQPGASQFCSIANNTGLVVNSAINNISVTCATVPSYSVSVTVAGLAGSGLILQNNNDDDLNIAADGSFVFATTLLDGSSYFVSVLSQPTGPSQTCSVSDASGALSGNNITLQVSCSTNSYSIGVNVSGLTGSGLILQNNNDDDLNITADGSFVFASSALDGSSYSVSVSSQPTAPSQTCSVSDASGTLSGSNITLQVNCVVEPKTPVANAVIITVSQDTVTGIDIGNEPGNELGNAPSTVTASDPANGSVTVVGNIITYTPDSGYLGTDTFNYTITDADAEAATAAVNITVQDTTAPTARIKFPASVALTQINKVLVTGSASDNNTITRVRVAGTDAITTDGYANWRALVTLAPGENTLLIETRDEFSNIDSAAASLSVAFSGPIMPSQKDLVVDAGNGRALVIDDSLNAVIAVDLLDGTRTILSDNATPDTVTPFGQLQGITLDADNGRALVVDITNKAVVAVNLLDGARTILSDNATPDATNSFSLPRGIVLDTKTSGRALVVDSGLNALLAVDLLTGERTILSDDSTPDTVNPFGYLRGITLDPVNDRVLAVDSDLVSGLNAVVAVDLLTGARTILSDASTPDATNPFNDPKCVTLDAANDRALVADSGLGAVVAVDLLTGARTILSDASTPDATNLFNDPKCITLDAANDRALVADSGLGAVVAVDLLSGARSILSADAVIPDTANPLKYPLGMVLDTANGRALLVDAGLDAVVAVDLLTSERTIFSDATTPDTANPLNDPQGIMLDAANGRALVADAGLGAVVAVDLLTGVRSIFSDDTTPDTMNPLASPMGIVLDAANGRALVIDGGLVAVVAVDLLTGARTILSDFTTPDTVNPFLSLRSITLDATNGRALVVDVFNRAVLAVDLLTGERTILSDSNTPDASNSFVSPGGIVLDELNGRALVTDAYFQSVVAVDLLTGARTIFSDDSTPIWANPFSRPQGIVLDAANDRALVLDYELDAVIAVELTTGGRVIVSK